MNRPEGRVCATCHAWKESLPNYEGPNYKSPDAGECRLHPPLPLPAGESAWPQTKKHDWCEDWRGD